MEFKMNRNGSGYYDETASKAFEGMAKPGEIWTVGYGDREKEVLIIKNHGKLCNVLSLLDESKNNHCIEIASRSLKYTDPRMLQYSFNDSMGQFVKALPDDEFDKVLDEIEDALELNIYRNIYRPEAEEVNEAVEALEQKVKELEDLLAKAQEISDTNYKEKYQKLVLELIDRGLMGVVML